MKMEKSYKNKGIRLLFYFLSISIGIILPVASSAETPNLTARTLENEIMNILGKNIQCKKIVVQIRLSQEKPNEIKTLAVKFENAVIGDLVADYITIE